MAGRVVGVVPEWAAVRMARAGLRIIKNHGGLALVQDPVEAPVPQMPAAAFAQDDPEVSADRSDSEAGGAEFCVKNF